MIVEQLSSKSIRYFYVKYKSTYLRVSSIWSHDCQGAPTISLTGISARSSSADHCGGDSVVAVLLSTDLVGDGGDIHLLENIRPGTSRSQSPPASHYGSHVVIVRGGVWQTDWLDS